MLCRPRSRPLSLQVESTHTASSLHSLHLQIRGRMTEDGFLTGRRERQESCLVPKIQAVWPDPIFHSNWVFSHPPTPLIFSVGDFAFKMCQQVENSWGKKVTLNLNQAVCLSTFWSVVCTYKTIHTHVLCWVFLMELLVCKWLVLISCRKGSTIPFPCKNYFKTKKRSMK